MLEAEISRVMHRLSLDRKTAIRHIESRERARELVALNRRAVLTHCASLREAGRLDSPPAPSAPPLRPCS